MNDRRGGDEHGDRDQRHHDDRGGRGGPDGGSDSGRGGPDTRFLQLEMSRVLYSEAEDVAKPAFRELLLEAAKTHLRERFGEEIKRLARLAIDDLLMGIEASLDVEDQIQSHNESSGGRTDDRLREALGRKRTERSQPSAGRKERRGAASRTRRR